jgi:3-deoxy-D-manno-octulosonic-acid transferase
MFFIKLYQVFLRIILFFITPFSPYLKKKFQRINYGYDDYFGRISTNFKSDENVCWIHGVSVGEINCGSIFIERLKKSGIENFLVTTTCVEAVKMAEKIDGNISVSYYPIDLPVHYDEIFKRVNINSIYIMEVDIWPNLILKAAEYNVPVVLINGRVSKKTFGFYSYFPTISKIIFSKIKVAFVQTKKDMDYLLKLGMDEKKIVVSGNIKFDLEVNKNKLGESDFKKIKLIDENNRKLNFVGGSTHVGEEDLLIDSINFMIDKKKIDREDFTLILVPRDIKRSNLIVELVKVKKMSVLKWSEISEIIPQVVVVDKFGVLMEIYKNSNFIFIGGSTGKIGGHSIIEGIIAKKPIITGSDMRNFQEITDIVMEKKSGIVTEKKEEIANFIDEILNTEFIKLIATDQYNY